jgi:hypothetical protein
MISTSRRSLLAAAIAMAILVAPAGGWTAAAADMAFRDTGSHWAKGTIEWASSLGIVDGYGDGTFRPDKRVTEPEFLAMLLRAYPEAGANAVSEAGVWYDGYYKTARGLGWSVLDDTGGILFNRGHVAQLIASTQGSQLGVREAVEYLLNRKLSEGKTSATVDGYGASDWLTRAEAIQFLRNAKERGLAISDEPVPANRDLEVRGISLGDTEASVKAKLGEPVRRDLSRYGFDWLIYNQDLLQYTQVGILNGKVVGLYTSGSDWKASSNVEPAMTRAELVSGLGESLDSILKGNTNFILNKDGESDVYLMSGAFVTFFYDIHEGGRVNGFQIVEKAVEQSLQAFYGQPSDRLRDSFERESFDLANAARAERGLPVYVWNDKVATVSRLHSQDMADKSYFSHKNMEGESPYDRAAALGLRYSQYGENIAAGQQDAVGAHHGWMNSEGHRVNILGTAKELGTGVAFGGDMYVYYTQNFYTER